MSRILVDIDDTIEDLLPAWINYLNNLYGLNVKLSDCNDWDMQLLFPTLTHEQITNVLVDYDLWKTVQPKEDAIFYLKQLQKEGNEIVLVTSSRHYNIQAKLDTVISNYFSFIPSENIVVAHRKGLVQGDVLIDDYIRNLLDGSYKKILYTAQHNLNTVTSGTEILRANSWNEVYWYIHLLFD